MSVSSTRRQDIDEAGEMKKLRLLTSVTLLVAPVVAAAMYMIEPAPADIIGCSTATTIIPGFPVESIAVGLVVGLLIVLLASHRGFEWIRTRIGARTL